MGVQDEPVGLLAFAYETVTVAAAVKTLTAGTYLDAVNAEISLETAQIRTRVDGGNPSATVGHLLEVGDIMRLDSADAISTFKAYRTGGVSGIMKVTYFH